MRVVNFIFLNIDKLNLKLLMGKKFCLITYRNTIQNQVYFKQVKRSSQLTSWIIMDSIHCFYGSNNPCRMKFQTIKSKNKFADKKSLTLL